MKFSLSASLLALSLSSACLYAADEYIDAYTIPASTFLKVDADTSVEYGEIVLENASSGIDNYGDLLNWQ